MHLLKKNNSKYKKNSNEKSSQAWVPLPSPEGGHFEHFLT